MKTIKEIDRGWQKIKRDFLGLKKGYAAAVGVQGPAASESHGEEGLTNTTLAAYHEYGDDSGTRPPQRSFLRSTLEDNEDKYQAELKKIAAGAFEEGDAKGNLLLLGEQCRKDILDKIHAGIAPALSEATIEQKGGKETPLIRTGQLINSISTKVDERDKFEEGA